ncbi:hypothetical protein GCM10028862_17410 [Luteimonas pelagia]
MLEIQVRRASVERNTPRTDLRTAFAAAGAGMERPAGARGHVVVGLFELAEWRAWLPEARALLDPPERHRVSRRRFQHDREALALSYALHRLLLGRVLACDPLDVPLRRDARGCPRIAATAWTTSLSHADGCCAVAVASAGPVGIDIEPADRASVMPGIAERVCHPVDAAELAPLVQPAWSAALLALWVRKEALLKAAGVGLAREMSSFPAPRDGRLPLVDHAGTWAHASILDAGPRHVVAVAAPPGLPVVSGWWRPAREVPRAQLHDPPSIGPFQPAGIPGAAARAFLRSPEWTDDRPRGTSVDRAGDR